jgi:hypothetical protein
MGDRGQVHIEDTNVALYTHWGGSELVKDVKEALAKRWRWYDPEYLARIIFEGMIGDQNGTETGFGITSGTEFGWCHTTVKVNCKTQEVCVIQDGKREKVYSFEEFIA